MPEPLGWDFQSFGDEPLRVNRYPLMRPVQYERTAALSEVGSVEDHKSVALTVNVGSGGMCLLMDRPPSQQEVLRVHVPTPVALVKTPTLAEVCWKRHVPLGRNGLYFVGVKFVL